MQAQAGYPSLKTPAGTPIRRLRSDGLTPYPEALERMEAIHEGVRAGHEPETLWLLEHPPLYTAGISGRDADLLDQDRFPVFHTGRGGQYTYHGPGQRVAYLMLDLNGRGRDLHAYVEGLERWIISALASVGVRGETRKGRVGVWTQLGGGEEAKIAAIGVKTRRWATLHGVAINVAPDLSHFAGIVPCGLPQFGVTSLAALGVDITMPMFDELLLAAFVDIFGPIEGV